LTVKNGGGHGVQISPSSPTSPAAQWFIFVKIFFIFSQFEILKEGQIEETSFTINLYSLKILS
jgi:hypothetical protein